MPSLPDKNNCDLLFGTQCSIVNEKCFRIGFKNHCDYADYWIRIQNLPDGTPRIAKKVTGELVTPFRDNLRSHLKNKALTNVKRILASPVEERLRELIKTELAPLGVAVPESGKIFEIWEDTTIIADGKAEKLGYPVSLFSFKTWIGPEQIRETFAYSYLAKTWLGHKNVNVYEIGIYHTGKKPDALRNLTEACKPYLDGVFYLTMPPYIDELIRKLKEIYSENKGK
jgi:hypothetical protein